MSSLDLGRFSRPDTLASVRTDLLRQFFEPFTGYFAYRDFDIATLEGSQPAEALEVLSSILISPCRDTPRELIDALFCIQEVATPKHSDMLEATAAGESVRLPADATALEMAISIWMASPDAIKQLHQRHFVSKVRSFEYYCSGVNQQVPLELNDERVGQLERSLAVYFEKKKRGYGCKLHHFSQEHENWFVICHGGLLRRKSTWEDGKAGSIAYRPERFDLVIYDAIAQELRVNARTDSLREHYRRQFGFYLFGREQHFADKSKYCLEPLIRDRKSALITKDTSGLDSVTLTELCYEILDGCREVRTHRAPDVFDALEQHQLEIPSNVRTLEASFKVRFSGQQQARSLTLKPSNTAHYARDDGGQLIEEWLMRRGFIQYEEISSVEQLEHVLAIY